MINILIADDHHLIRAGLAQILDERKDIHILEAEDGGKALDMIKNESVNLVILDISMPVMNGLEVLKEIRHLPLKVPVLVLSTYGEEQYAIRAMKAGARGYLAKDSAPEYLLEAIDKMLGGQSYFSDQVQEKVLQLKDRDANKELHEMLSDREYEVLQAIGSGKSVSQIATDLYLSVKTVSTYRSRLLKKMGLKNNAELTRYAVDNRLA